MRRWNHNTPDYHSAHQTVRMTSDLKTDTIGQTWWSKRWVDVLEAFGMGTRLARGRSYARQGQVLSIDITPGVVQARVRGAIDKPYEITIQLQPLSSEQWEQVMMMMVSRAVFAAKLLAGEMPRDIEEAFRAVHLSLFPTSEADLHTNCSCPDWARPCKHIAAVYYILAERFDADPFLLFKLRGCSKEEIIEMLRQKRTAIAPAGEPDVIDNMQTNEAEEETFLRLEDRLDTFWQAGEILTTFAIHPRDPQIENVILKRLGAAPYSIQGQDILSLLARAYDVVEKAALHKAVEE